MKKVLLAMLIMVSFPLSAVYADPSPVNLEFGYVDPTGNEIGQQRGPITIPEVSIDDYTLSFITPCDGCTLRLLDENDNVVFTTIISSSTLVLPSTLSGEWFGNTLSNQTIGGITRYLLSKNSPGNNFISYY